MATRKNMPAPAYLPPAVDAFCTKCQQEEIEESLRTITRGHSDDKFPHLANLNKIVKELFWLWQPNDDTSISRRTVPSYDNLMSELKDLLNKPRLSPNKREHAERFQEKIAQTGENSFLALTQAALQERNAYVLADYLRLIGDMDDVYCPGTQGGLATQMRGAVRITPTEENALSDQGFIGINGKRLFTCEYPIETAKSLMGFARNVGLETVELVKTRGPRSAYALMFSGTDVDFLRNAGADIIEGLRPESRGAGMAR